MNLYPLGGVFTLRRRLVGLNTADDRLCSGQSVLAVRDTRTRQRLMMRVAVRQYRGTRRGARDGRAGVCRGVDTAWCGGLDYLTYLLEANRSKRFGEEVGRVVRCRYVFSFNMCKFDVVS